MKGQRTAFFCSELFHIIFSNVHKVILTLRLALRDLLFIDYFNVYFLFIFILTIYGRVCPFPYIIYFVLVSASSPIGPLA